MPSYGRFNSRRTFSGALSLLMLMNLSALAGDKTGDKNGAQVRVEQVTASDSWVSPCWGYNAPKIVRGGKGTVWALNFFGRYPVSSAQLFKRLPNGTWQPGKVFSGNYQPAMIFLDDQQRLNLIQNSETEPIRQFRSTDDENLNNFELVASGNGLASERGWYVGVGIHGATIYLSYITLSYDLYLTWKGVTEPTWHRAILVHAGEVNATRGNHSWLYPRFYFQGGEGYIAVSSTVDGTTHNTYDKIHLIRFPLTQPERFTSELVYAGPVGYYTYCTDMIVMPDGTILCGFRAGQRKYGPEQATLSPGLYVAVRRRKQEGWKIYQADDHDGIITLDRSKKGTLYALVTRGEWNEENHVLLKKSDDGGRTWSMVIENIFARYPEVKRPFFMQTAHAHSGSVLNNVILGLSTNLRSTEARNGIYTFDLLEIEIPIN